MQPARARAAIVAGGAALFAATIGGELVFDDRLTIEENTVVTGPFSLRGFFTHDYWGFAVGDPEGPGTYRPLVSLSFWIDHHLGGGRAWVFHLVNVLLFALTLLAADRFLERFAASISRAARLFALAAFAAAAIHVDVVPNVSGRAELLAMLFILLAAERALVPEKRPRDVALIAVCTTLAILSKESAVPMGLFVAWLARPAKTRRTASVAAAVLPVAIALIARRAMKLPFSVHGERWQFLNPLMVAPPSLRAHGVVQAFGHYLQHLFAPVNLCPDYGYGSAAPEASVNLAAIVGVLGLVAILGALVAARRHRLLFDAVLGLALSYVVVSHVFARAMVFVADRVFFLPSFFVIVLAAIALDLAVTDRKRRLVAIGAGGLIALQALITVLGALVWKDNYRLGSWGVRACPTGLTLRLIRAPTAEARGEYEEAAWALLVVADVYRRFPAPIPERLVSRDWEDEPVADRVAHFRAARPPKEFAEACAAAHRYARASHTKETAAVIARWCAVTGS